MQNDNSFYMILDNVNYYISKDYVEDRFLFKDLSGAWQMGEKKNVIYQNKGYVFYEIWIE